MSGASASIPRSASGQLRSLSTRQPDPALTARGAKLTVTYTDDDFAPGKILARQDFIVP